MRLKKRIKQEVGILNDPEVADLCQDKLKTYNKFKQHVPQTKEATEDNIRDMIEEFGKVIIKPRYGSSGEGIEVIENVSDFEKPVDWDDILVQRFIQTSGIKELDVEGAHDLRVIIVNDEAIGSYLRIPAENQILSNVAQGGSKRYLSLEDIPKDAMNIVDEVASELEDYRPIIYTVDLMFAEGKPWIIELNSQPGIYYHGSGRKKDWEESWMKKVVDAVVELVKD